MWVVDTVSGPWYVVEATELEVRMVMEAKTRKRERQCEGGDGAEAGELCILKVELLWWWERASP